MMNDSTKHRLFYVLSIIIHCRSKRVFPLNTSFFLIFTSKSCKNMWKGNFRQPFEWEEKWSKYTTLENRTLGQVFIFSQIFAIFTLQLSIFLQRIKQLLFPNKSQFYISVTVSIVYNCLCTLVKLFVRAALIKPRNSSFKETIVH